MRLVEGRTNNLALDIEQSLLRGWPSSALHSFTAFSDICFYSDAIQLESNRHFQQLDRLFPESYFILNDRDPERWIRSRVRHSKGTMLKRAMAYYGGSEADVCAIWRRDREEHNAAVLDYFQSNSRFLHFKIDSDPVEKLAAHLKPHFSLNLSAWRAVNVTTSQSLRPASAASDL
ncbi:hypothetical protein FJQ55_08535 [Rhizobium glycinendophyticum]|uniref:Sulfotransferase family protein n=2 Tax=Rhizobium glycinendophyticum TaxID=2589807 RepID=A0A504U756_9HYPH|nr:hypothetical protein FJQ55_08535 [Rhizobium glycinendophyticum]